MKILNIILSLKLNGWAAHNFIKCSLWQALALSNGFDIIVSLRYTLTLQSMITAEYAFPGHCSQLEEWLCTKLRICKKKRLWHVYIWIPKQGFVQALLLSSVFHEGLSFMAVGHDPTCVSAFAIATGGSYGAL